MVPPMTRAAFIVDGIRSPFGRYGGGLGGVRADDLAGAVIAALVARTKIPADRIDDVILGCANRFAQPRMTTSMRSAGIFVRATSAAITAPARSSARTPPRPPPYRPNGERIPSTIKAARVMAGTIRRKLANGSWPPYRRGHDPRLPDPG